MTSTFYSTFSLLCLGKQLKESVVTEMLPSDNYFVQVMKLYFCANLHFLPAHNHCTFIALEASILGKAETNTIEEEVAADHDGG